MGFRVLEKEAPAAAAPAPKPSGFRVLQKASAPVAPPPAQPKARPKTSALASLRPSDYFPATAESLSKLFKGSAIDKAEAVTELSQTAGGMVPLRTAGDLLKNIYVPATAASEMIRRRIVGQPQLPADELLAESVRSFPNSTLGEMAGRGAIELVLTNPTTAARGLRSGFRVLSNKLGSTSLGTRIRAGVEARTPVTVKQAEQAIRTGKKGPGFARRVSQLSIEERQALARNLGQVQPDAPSTLALPGPEPAPPAISPGKPVFALRLKGGDVIQDLDVKAHVDLVERFNIDPDDIESTGFVVAGKYQTQKGNVRPELQKMYVQAAKDAGYDVREGAATGARIAKPLNVEDAERAAIQGEAAAPAKPLGLQIRAATEKTVVPPDLPKRTRLRIIEQKLGQLDSQMRTLERQRELALRSNRPHGLLDRKLEQLSREFNGAEANLADILVGNAQELKAQLAKEKLGTVRLEELERIERVAQTRIKSAASAADRQATIRTKKQIISELGEQFKLAAPIIRAAQRKGLTSAQLARFAEFQRTEVGEQVVGPRGGLHKSPLSGADVRRIEATTERIVPRNISEYQRQRLEQGGRPRLPEGPNQPPPVIPSNKALVPSDFRAQRDIPVQWTRATAEQDIQRLAQYVDGKMLGPVNRAVVQPVLDADTRAMAKQEAKLAEFRKMAQGLKKDSVADARMLRAAEDRLAPNDVLTANEQRLVDEWKRFAKQAIEEDINPTLVSLGKKAIAPRANYAPHLPALSFLADLFGGLENLPDELIEKLPVLRSVMETPISQRDPGLPSAVRDLPYVPKHQSAFFLKPRVGGPFRESLMAGIEAYVPLWARITEVAPIVQSVKPLVKRMPQNFRAVSEQWLAEQMGRKPKMDTMTDSKALNALRRFNHMSASSLIVGRVSTALLQYSSLANTATRHGWIYTLRGYRRALTDEGSGLAERFCRELQQRIAVGTLLEGNNPTLRIANAALEITDQQMVTTAFLSALEDYIHMSPERFKQLAGVDKTVDSIFNLANISAEQTQASMRKALQSPVTRSQLLRAVASNLQTFSVNMRQQAFLDPEILKLATTKKEAALYQAKLVANMLSMNMVYKFFGLRAPNEISDFVPIFDPFTGAVPVGTIAKAVQSGGRFIPLTALVAGLGFKIAKDLKEKDGKLSMPTMRDLVKVVMLPIPGGSQIAITIEGAATLAAGGRRNRRDPTRFDYRVEGGLDALRVLALGPTASRGYQDYRERENKPIPLTEAEKRRRRQQSALKRSILPDLP